MMWRESAQRIAATRMNETVPEGTPYLYQLKIRQAESADLPHKALKPAIQ
jgi:hypothetical protein